MYNFFKLFFFLQRFKYVISVISWLLWFLMRSAFDCIFFWVWVIFLYGFQGFVFIFFSSLTMRCLGMDLFGFFLLRIHLTSWICSLMLFYQVWDIFSHCLFPSFLLLLSLFCLLLDLPLCIWWYPTCLWGSIHFLLFLFLFLPFKVDYFYWYVFEFTHSFLCHLKSVPETI